MFIVQMYNSSMTGNTNPDITVLLVFTGRVSHPKQETLTLSGHLAVSPLLDQEAAGVFILFSLLFLVLSFVLTFEFGVLTCRNFSTFLPSDTRFCGVVILFSQMTQLPGSLG